MSDDYNQMAENEAAYFGQKEEDWRDFEEEMRERVEELAIFLATDGMPLGGLNPRLYWETATGPHFRAEYTERAKRAIELLLARGR